MATRPRSLPFFFQALMGLFVCLPLAGPALADITSASSLDDTDQQERHDALDRVLAAAPGAQEDWSNINSGHRGTFKSMSERPSDGGQTCRGVAETVSFQDGQSSGTVVACRTGDDPWRIVSSNLDPKTTPKPTPSPVSQPPGLGNIPVQVWVGMPSNAPGTTVAAPRSSGSP